MVARRRARRRARGDAARRPTACSRARAGSTSGSSAARPCSSSCCSGTSSPRSIRRSRSAIPFGGPELMHADANTLITPFAAATLGLALNEAAYMAEIVRAGIISVDAGQSDAAHALGMTRLQTMRHIVLPQAMRVIVPPTGNEAISMLKTTSHRQRHRLHRPALFGPADLLGELPAGAAAAGGVHLVPRVHDRCCRSASTSSSAGWPRGAGMIEPAVRIEAVHKRFGGCGGAARHLAARRTPARSSACSGPSGSGKSTLLRCINHLEKIDAGRLWVGRRARRLPAGRATCCTSCPNARSRASARRSAWSSSASTCSRT